MATLGSKQLKQGKENQKHQVSDEPEAHEVGEWVVLEMKLIDWSYMDFSRTIRVDNTSLSTIKEVIKKWHGGNIASLTVYNGSIQEGNELRGDDLTMKECGIDGFVNKNEAPVVTLYYDFKPDGCTEPDPILMC